MVLRSIHPFVHQHTMSTLILLASRITGHLITVDLVRVGIPMTFMLELLGVGRTCAQIAQRGVFVALSA